APNRFQVQFDEFSDCVLTGKAPEYPPEDGLRNMAAIVALLASARDGGTVPVEQI
ncbi:MAG: gfo/Idh/MocA family oxidoreductase, partial [Planctomycetes bacterium]|nr:gfo/Idh/MocA family oxidoreductase [Planctomycetota bacterium]